MASATYPRPAPSTAAALEDTVLPGLPRRVLWAAPALLSPGAVALRAGKLFLSARPLNPDAAAALDAGADPAGVLPAGFRVVDLATLEGATLDLAAHAIRLFGNDRRQPGWPPLRFADAATADDLFTRLVQRGGPGCRVATDRPPAGELARTPIGVIVGILVATAILAVTVSGLDDALANEPLLRPQTAPVWLKSVAWLDWRAVCGSGGAALAVAQVWLYRRLTDPPRRLVLTRRDFN